ncbi:MAG: B12-binding domain-containing radical SAM protein [Phycisphaerales bacterium]|nr:B12-binding domain-containing radical SAM protein [Phycisphaerales bacterium]
MSQSRRDFHVALVAFVGLRIGEERMLELGMRLPGLAVRANAISQLPALGLLTIAGMTPEPWTCSFHEAGNDGFEALLDEVLAKRPAVVAISALTASIEQAYAFSGAVRRAGIRVVMGGLHVTCCANEARQYCDAVVVGDGEATWAEVLRDVELRALKPIYRATKPFDLAHAPAPRFDLLGPKPRKRMMLQTQRGCPFACEFCGASRLLGSFREKSVERIEAELAAICAIDAGATIELADDNTFVRRRDAELLFGAFERADVRYFTEADWRLGERPELLAGLAKSGCVQVLVGIESLVFQHQGMGAKQAELPRVMEAIGRIQEAGVCVIGCFIVGCDGETRGSIDRLAEFIEGSELADVQLTVQTPFPGTSLHRRLRTGGRLLAERGWRYYSLFDVTYVPDQMTADELQHSFYEVVRRVFSPMNSARRAVRRRKIWERHPRIKSCESRLY